MQPREFFTTGELIALKSGQFTFDVESYHNYFLVAFKHLDTGKYCYFESINDAPVQADWLQWMLDNFCLVGFYSGKYDVPIVSLAAQVPLVTCAMLKAFTDDLIIAGDRPRDLLEQNNCEMLRPNHIDLAEVAPLTGSLKTYAARLHCPHMQDLPFDPSRILTLEEIAIVRTYCFNDLDNTELLLRALWKSLDLRAALSAEFGKDLRSRSDAQIAQEIINLEITRVMGKMPKRINFLDLVGSTFNYQPPSYIKFASPEYNAILAEICGADIEIGSSGHVICPKSIEGRTFIIDGKRYAIGMGGLHSQEKCQAIVGSNHRVLDRDVTGYYPNLILKNGFAPAHLGQYFLDALQNIVDRRYKAKKSGNTTEADGLKIASNGTFGKLSDPFSSIYSPQMMVQTTLTGQLSLLMAIEMLVMSGYSVVSANTDGVVALCEPERYSAFCGLWVEWEQLTKLETEETEYSALYARDVNNYIGITLDGKVKQKGEYAYVGSALNSPLSKNPSCLICIDAAIARIKTGKPLIDTITECNDITRFVTVEKVTGGAQKDGRYLGKTVRWYYAANVIGAIVKCKSGNKVPKSDGGKPLMTLPPSFPQDVDVDRYVMEAEAILEAIGFQAKRNAQLTLV